MTTLRIRELPLERDLLLVELVFLTAHDLETFGRPFVLLPDTLEVLFTVDDLELLAMQGGLRLLQGDLRRSQP